MAGDQPGGAELRLLTAAEPQPAVATNPAASSPLLIVCDHAGRATPRALGSLGLPEEAFERHIAWDVGAGALSLLLGEAFGACVIRQTYSRLVVDCNRAPGRADAIVAVSDGTPIPGNVEISPEEAGARFAEIHAPYHARIATELDLRAGRGLETLMVAIHSFTPTMDGFQRPWDVGVLHLGDSALSRAMLASLAAEPGLAVGDNEPYAMDGIDYTIPLHAQGRGLDYLEIEVRQDLISDLRGQARMADLIHRRLVAALGAMRGG